MNKSSFDQSICKSIIVLIFIIYNVRSDEEIVEPIRFAGLEWEYKIGDKRGPGPNIFKLENIHVDREDRLHLYIRKDKNEYDGGYNWTCAEVYSKKTGKLCVQTQYL